MFIEKLKDYILCLQLCLKIEMNGIETDYSYELKNKKTAPDCSEL